MVYVDAAKTTNPQARGVWGRLDAHRRFKRTSNLAVQLMDSVIIPTLTRADLSAVGDSTLDPQQRLRAWGLKRVLYRTWISPDGSSARRVEQVVRREGLPGVGKPRLNPA